MAAVVQLSFKDTRSSCACCTVGAYLIVFAAFMNSCGCLCCSGTAEAGLLLVMLGVSDDCDCVGETSRLSVM